FFFQAEDGIRDRTVTGVQTCALPISGTIRSLLRGERPVLRGDGTSRRDYLYARDAATAYLTLADAAELPDRRGQAFNFSSESPRSEERRVGKERRGRGGA